MFIEVEPNPNCKKSDLFVFNEMGNPKPVTGLKLTRKGADVAADVAGVDAGGKFVQAFAQKVQDSGAGFGFLIFGGAWGIRLRPSDLRYEKWDLSNPNQWGETYLVYADEEGLILGEIK